MAAMLLMLMKLMLATRHHNKALPCDSTLNRDVLYQGHRTDVLRGAAIGRFFVSRQAVVITANEVVLVANLPAPRLGKLVGF